MESTLRRPIKKAFVIQEDHLKRIVSTLGGDCLVKIEVSCIRGLSLSPRTLEDALLIENAGFTEIEAMSFKSSREHLRASIVFDRSSFNPIRYDLSGEHEEVLALSNKLDGLVSLVGQRYGWLSIDDTARTVVTAFFHPAAVIMIVMSLALIRQHKHFSIALFLFTLGVLLLLEQKLLRFLYPVGQFAIGRGKEEIEKTKQRRTTYGIGAILAVFIMGLIVNYISHVLGL